jgi:NTP pyrophosphatase (non-canonical NTP hydrolase)
VGDGEIMTEDEMVVRSLIKSKIKDRRKIRLPKFVRIYDDDILEAEAYRAISGLVYMAHITAVKKGFWDKPRNVGEIIALIHSELSEALQELRKPDCSINKVGEEMADAVIRIFDFCATIPFWEQILIMKMKENMKREYKHGKRF